MLFCCPLMGSEVAWPQLHDIALQAYRDGAYARADTYFSRALRELDPATVDYRLLTTLGNLAATYMQEGKLAEAELVFGRIAQIEPTILALGSDVSGNLFEIEINRAALAFRLGRIPEARHGFEKLLPTGTAMFGGSSLPVAQIQSYLALIYNQSSMYNRAREYAEVSLATRCRILGEGSPQSATSMTVLAQVLEKQNDLDQAETLAREALEIRRRSPNQAKQCTEAKIDLGTILKRKGNYVEAERLYLDARKVLGAGTDLNGFELALVANNLASLYQSQGKLRQAEKEFRYAATQMERSVGPDSPALSLVLTNYSALYRATRKWDAAGKLLRRAYAIDEKQFGKDSARVASDLITLAEVSLAKHDLEKPEGLLFRALDVLQSRAEDGGASLADATFLLAVLYQERGQPEKASPFFRACNLDLGPSTYN